MNIVTNLTKLLKIFIILSPHLKQMIVVIYLKLKHFL